MRLTKEKLEELNLNYFKRELPCPLKLVCGAEIKVYPVKVIDAELYANAITLFNYDKDKLITLDDKDDEELLSMKKQAIIELQQMKYLQFLIDVIYMQDPETIGSRLAILFKLCLHEDYVHIQDDKGNIYREIKKGKKTKYPLIVVTDENGYIKYTVNKTDFEKLKDIILNQNDANHDNRELSASVRNVVEAYYRVKNRDSYFPTFEERKYYVMAKMNKTLPEIDNLYLRSFYLLFKAYLDSEAYLITSIRESSEKVTIKQFSENPLYTKPKDYVDEAFTSSDEFRSKIK